MLDASDLALALANAATIDDAIHTYEKTMLPRSIETAQAVEGGAEHLLAIESPDDATTTPSSKSCGPRQPGSNDTEIALQYPSKAERRGRRRPANLCKPAEETEMRLTVVAATGGIGSQILAQAVVAGHEVTAVVRNPVKLADLPCASS